MMEDDGFLEWLSTEEDTSKRHSFIPPKKKLKTATPQSALTIQEAGRIAILYLCSDHTQIDNTTGVFKKYKTKKLQFTGAELCGWLALHIYFSPDSTEESRKQLLWQTIRRFLELSLVSALPGQSKEINESENLEAVCPVGLDTVYKVNEEELLLGISQNLQSANIRLAVDVLSSVATPKVSEPIVQSIDWKQLKNRILELGEEIDSDEIRFYKDEHKLLVSVASLERLIERIANVNQPDVIFRDCFMLTYPTFVDTLSLLCLLRERWRYKSISPENCPEKEIQELIDNTTKTIQLRVLNFLKLWIENYPNECKEPVILSKLELIFNEIKKEYPSAQKTLQQAIQNTKKKEDNIDEILAVKKPDTNIIFIKLDPKELAEQWSIVDHTLFCKIRSSEFLMEKWTHEDKWKLAGNICNLELRFDAILQWATITILKIKLEDRTEALSFCISLAKCFWDLENYFSSIAILLALQSETISRLKRTWDSLDNEILDKYKFLETNCDTSDFSSFQLVLTKAKAPCVPLLSLYLQQLTDIHHSAEDTVDGLINFRKHIRSGKLLMDIKRFQSVAYSFELKPEIIWYVLNITPKDFAKTNELLKMSKNIEPEDPETLIEKLLLKEKLMLEEMRDVEHQIARLKEDIISLEKENKKLEGNYPRSRYSTGQLKMVHSTS